MHKETAPVKLSESPAYQLWLASNAWVRYLKRVLRPFKLTHVQFAILTALDVLCAEKEQVSQADVARFGALDENMISQVSRALARRDLLERVPHPVDRRAHSLVLTDAGTALIGEARLAVRAASKEFFAVLDTSERDELVKSLRTLVAQQFAIF